MAFDKFYEARSIIEDFLYMDLIGPLEEDEIIEEGPSQYYSMGILFPQKVEVDPLEQVNNENVKMDEKSMLKDYTHGDSFEDVDRGISLSNMYQPSSMAISTTISSGVNGLKVSVKYGKYELVQEGMENGEAVSISDDETEIEQSIEVEEISNESSEGKNQLKKKKYNKQRWKRAQVAVQKEVLFQPEQYIQIILVDEGLELQIYIQKTFADGSKTITIALVNTHKGNSSSKINEMNGFYQVSFDVTAINENDPIFIPKKMNVEISEDTELKNLNMLYSHVKNYALGHGCAVEPYTNEIGCYKLSSRTMPKQEVKQMMASVKVNTKILQMNFLATESKEKVVDGLTELVSSYDEWVRDQIKESEKLDKRFENSSKENIGLCKETSDRIKHSIKMLEDDMVFRAFQLANQAMLDQRVAFMEREGKKVDLTKMTWYPFQLAFLLQEIPSIVDTKNKYRDIVDLLWFPTGGGKTEAYLGISAFIIFLRRLRHKDAGAGVTIIMRYTLRLLTIQQFERAAALICACESIRKNQKFGGEEISIGLFVGGGLTPNKLSDAEKSLQKIQRNGIKAVTEGNPCQILKCPVCGAAITPQQYEIKNGHMKIFCPNKDCEYKDGLPIYLIDEDIYNFKPTLIISTVDKFARMTWEPKIGQIFGIDSPYLPPDLIIQDELHLIAGPLGTVTGLYETAIDFFCYRKGIKPKIIASTATIRNAANQILSLYAREHRQFPPQGINIRDSYFAVEATIDERPGRKYIGVLSPHKSATTTLIRVYALLQFATRYLKDKGFEDEVVDNYWTLTGYFNSLRELGGAVVQVYDDVQDRYAFLYNTKFKKLNPSFSGEKKYEYLEELTSRKNQSEITKALEDLSRTYETGEAFDYVLASNMISVGVDISRLGLMVVNGQPKSNSEYIQASSRVGRKNPGLVISVYNPSRSRDRSHYEQFMVYHSAMYKHVESTSLTPFSARARERALSAVYISMCRHWIAELRDEKSARNYDQYDDRLQEIEDFILERAETILRSELGLQETAEELDDIKLRWQEVAEFDNLTYSKYGKGIVYPLLKNTEEEEGSFQVLNSMRNVDFQSNVFLEED
ncbi:helicase-related protein [Alkaliphilus oremlandii]|uniref:Helicase domain protein n=1 Tax=Alkaliphilus oremlandii (strain OhILAs) TaxID=350688 RepID=A8MID7_ALKOO|nr:helicase-related protein [Alkaliphilus oremlandii]ABW19569.1 helicase domain protein [Alkaliphilus oremlandii OhILAs]